MFKDKYQRGAEHFMEAVERCLNNPCKEIPIKLMDRTPPDCNCDIKALVSYGHEKGCHYIAWKTARRDPL
jgi:hypothetical protein